MAESDLDFAIDEINREQDRWNYIEAELESANKLIAELNTYNTELKRTIDERNEQIRTDAKRVAELEELLADRTQDLEFEYANAQGAERRVIKLEEVLEEIRDLARTGTPPDAYGMTSLEEWEHYKINRIAGMANEALNK